MATSTDPFLQPPIHLGPICDGIDRKDLYRLRERFHSLNQVRLERMLSALTERQREFIELIPAFWHLNHPLLPGYGGADTPSGISEFLIDKEMLRRLKRYSKSLKTPEHSGRQNPESIFALFVMGSVGTLAQSEKSDLDFWLCLNPALNKEQQKKLVNKAQALTDHAARLNLEIHFFPMNPEKFRRGISAGLDTEASGSAQHTLLLDEFYRTSIWLAGRDLIWWIIPSSENHQEHANTLLTKRFIKAKEFIDFGSSQTIPAGEYIGAAIWQLYKAIDSPYKSLLKLSLLEAYVNEYPDTEPLSEEFKKELYAGICHADKLDPYVQIYRRLERYLVQIKDDDRLQLIRRAFYFKANKALSKKTKNHNKSWQRLLLEREVTSWQWQIDTLIHLDNRENWNVPEVIEERKLLVRQLMLSWRCILKFRQENSSSVTIDPQELTILSNKLKAAFEKKAGKVDIINPNINPQLKLNQPVFKFQDSNKKHKLWQLFETHHNEIKSGRSLFELLLWCLVNKLLDISFIKNNLTFSPSDSAPDKTPLSQTLHSTKSWLNETHSTVNENNFHVSSWITHCLWSINTESTHTDNNLENSDIIENPLSTKDNKLNLVESIDIAWRNTWGEIFCRHYNNRSKTPAIIQAILDFLEFTCSHSNLTPPKLTLRCFQIGIGNRINRQLEKLLALAEATLLSRDENQTLNHYSNRLVIACGPSFYLLQRRKRKVFVKHCLNQEQLINQLNKAQSWANKIIIEPDCQLDPLIVYACQGFKGHGIHIYLKQEKDQRIRFIIIDERGSLFYFERHGHNLSPLLQGLNRFLRNCLNQINQHQLNEHGIDSVMSIEFFELTETNNSAFSLKPIHSHADLFQPEELEVKAIAYRQIDGIDWHIIINEQEFSSSDESHFVDASKAIMSFRKDRADYPIYVSHIDISDCQDSLCQHHSLQTLFYLHAKQEVESRLNHALKQHFMVG